MADERTDPLYSVVDALTTTAREAAEGVRTRVISVRRDEDGGVRVRLRPSHRADQPDGVSQELDAVTQATARTALTMAYRRSLPLARCFEQTNELCGDDDVVVQLPSQRIAAARARACASKHPFVQALGLSAALLIVTASILAYKGL